jgi:hypothetical protein
VPVAIDSPRPHTGPGIGTGLGQPVPTETASRLSRPGRSSELLPRGRKLEEDFGGKFGPSLLSGPGVELTEARPAGKSAYITRMNFTDLEQKMHTRIFA